MPKAGKSSKYAANKVQNLLYFASPTAHCRPIPLDPADPAAPADPADPADPAARHTDSETCSFCAILSTSSRTALAVGSAPAPGPDSVMVPDASPSMQMAFWTSSMA